MLRRLALVLVFAALVQPGFFVTGSARTSDAFGMSKAGDTPEAHGVTSAPCLATPVRGESVRAGGFVGLILPAYDVVEGRFRLHVGPYRDKSVPGGLSQKIPWRTNAPSKTGNVLVVVGTRLNPRPALKFTQTFGSSMRWMFPTIISPPAPGCWRLHLGSGRVKGSVVAWVDLLEGSR